MPLQWVPKWSKIFSFAAGALLIASCAARQFDNPVDPNNPARSFMLLATFPFFNGQPAGVSFDHEELWVADLRNRSLTRIRASDGSAQFNVTLPDTVFDVTDEDGGPVVWVTVPGGVNEIRRLQPLDANEPLRIFPSPGGDPRGIAFHDEMLWVLDGSDRTMTKIDPKTGGAVGDPVPAGALGQPGGLTFRGDELWAVDQRGSRLVQLDPDTGDELASFTLPVGKAVGVGSDGDSFYYSDSSGAIHIVKLLEEQDGARRQQGRGLWPKGGDPAQPGERGRCSAVDVRALLAGAPAAAGTARALRRRDRTSGLWAHRGLRRY